MSTTVALDGSSPRTKASAVLAAVRAHAEASPARVALVGDGGAIGYAELWRRVQDARGPAG